MNKAEIFNYITDEYSNMILHWAIKKISSRDEAADLAQEIMLQIFSSVSREVDRGKTIDKLENFIWKIAHNVWCYHLRGKNRNSVCISMTDFDVQSDDDFAARLGDEEEMKALISKMRRTVLFLNKMQRETMIMHYIEGFSIADIAKKLNCTESSVKWYLFDTRKKLKKELDTMENTNFVYRPGKLNVAKCGNAPAKPDTDVITNSATMQNILLICYPNAKSLDEIAQTLGIPKAYIESDIEWLINHEFLAESNNRYLTDIPIRDKILTQSVDMIYKNHKEKLSDVIIDSLSESEGKIREIGFIGCDKSIDKLLWLMIYMSLEAEAYGKAGAPSFFNWFEHPIRPDGGKYMPLGRNNSENQKSLENCDIDCNGFGYNGAMTANQFHWFGLYNFSQGSPKKLFESDSEKASRLRNTAVKCIQGDFNPDDLNENEKDALSEIIHDGWVTVKNNKYELNFYAFTHEQYETLCKSVFAPIYSKIHNERTLLKDELNELCKKSFSPHIYDVYKDFLLNLMIYDIIYYTEFFAMTDGKSYKPTDSKDGELLTLWCLVD